MRRKLGRCHKFRFYPREPMLIDHFIVSFFPRPIMVDFVRMQRKFDTAAMGSFYSFAARRTDFLEHMAISFRGLKDYSYRQNKKQERTMSKVIFAVLIAAVLGTTLDPRPAAAASLGNYEVIGVEDDDMLKLRAGPGVGYNVIVGLPNGTALRVHSCQQTGGTRWCVVSLKKAPRLKGHVSWAYLRKM